MAIPVKYICSRNEKLAKQAAALFPGCTGIADIDWLLQDGTIKGVFICTKNEYQLPLVKKCLQAGKYVFVEKPGVTGYDGLEELLACDQPGKCMIAFNKRFNPVNSQLAKAIGRAYSYQARYLTGAYPEGNAVMELFCHPIDNVLQLFGPPRNYHFVGKRKDRGPHLHVIIEHEHASGTLELSTCYSWASFKDQLQCLSARESIEINYPGSFLLSKLPGQSMGLPFDKLLGRHGQYLVSNGVAGVPVAANNSVVQHGYYQELAYFTEMVRKGCPLQQATPETFKHTFLLLQAIQHSIV